MSQLSEVLVAHMIDCRSLTEQALAESSQLYRLRVNSPEVLDLWTQLRNLVPITAHWPVLITEPKILERLPTSRTNQHMSDVIEKARQVDLVQWFIRVSNFYAHRWHTDELDAYPSAAWVLKQALLDIEAQYDTIGESFLAYEPLKQTIATALTDTSRWSELESYPEAKQLGLAAYLDTSLHPIQEYDMVLLPTTKPWEIPVLVQYQVGHSANLAEQVGLWHSWATRYGAEPVVLGRDGYTLRCVHPPTTAEEAVLLAWEHSIYCFDSIDRMEIVRYAQKLIRGKAWSFWWD